MMRVVALSAGSQYAVYVAREAVEEAYWQGRGAELLQLEWQTVRAKEFGDLTQRINPRTQEELKPWNGQKITFYDAIVHAPKSVSILSMLDERMASAHRMSTQQLMQELESQSAVWAHGENRPSGNLIMAPFEHRQSRAPDIHLHTHVTIMNLSFDHESQSWKALRAEPIFFNRHDLTEQYRECLAKRIEQLGYGIADKPRIGFEIDGVPKETIDRYSQRAAEIQEKLGEENRKVTIGNVAKWTRDSEKVVIPPAEFRELQLDKLTQAERLSLRQTVEKAYERSHKLRLQIDVAEGEESGPSLRPATYGQRISM
jgi:conjugative relaxase-like TrwC/TraI family protein